MEQTLLERQQELYRDIIDMFDIASYEFFKLCNRHVEEKTFDMFENSVTVCVDTFNLEALAELFAQ